jgi:glycine/D-amino acid oxidase-like deaminating enzyme
MSNSRIPHHASESLDKHYDAVVIGAGFAGMYALYRLRELGFEKPSWTLSRRRTRSNAIRMVSPSSSRPASSGGGVPAPGAKGLRARSKG